MECAGLLFFYRSVRNMVFSFVFMDYGEYFGLVGVVTVIIGSGELEFIYRYYVNLFLVVFMVVFNER